VARVEPPAGAHRERRSRSLSSVDGYAAHRW